jgi:hypothetical protein
MSTMEVVDIGNSSDAAHGAREKLAGNTRIVLIVPQDGEQKLKTITSL